MQAKLVHAALFATASPTTGDFTKPVFVLTEGSNQTLVAPYISGDVAFPLT